MSECRRLLAMPSPATSLSSSFIAEGVAADQPWGDSREAYLAWRIEHSKQEEEVVGDGESFHDVVRINKTLTAQGQAQDTAVGFSRTAGGYLKADQGGHRP